MSFNYVCLTSDEIKNKQQTVKKRILGMFITSGILTLLMFSQDPTIRFCGGISFLFLIVLVTKSLEPYPLGFVREQEYLANLVQWTQLYPELEGYRQQVLAMNRPFTYNEYYAMASYHEHQKCRCDAHNILYKKE